MAETVTSPALEPVPEGRRSGAGARSLADQAFSRAAGARLIGGNRVRLLRDATENYPAWIEAIQGAKRQIFFENYICHGDAVGTTFAEAMMERASQGVQVRLIYDWLGCLGTASRAFWQRLRDAGVEVRCYNPPRFESPLGWLSRDHRKVVVVDGTIGFVSGLCVGQRWAGEPGGKQEPWRDTGVEMRGPAVGDLARAFADVWALLGEPVPEADLAAPEEIAPAGEVSVRIVASEPATSRTFRLDQLVAAFARQRVWFTDAYYVGTSTFVQAITTAARHGVDVRLLLPSSSDVPLVSSLSRTGYRALLQAGVRIFEWNGAMLHAKTAVVDGRWARVGSTNLNLASWLGNYELDAVIEDEAFAQQMEAMYLEDLAQATEIVLNKRQRVRAPGRARPPGSNPHGRIRGRTATGAARIGHALGAAITNRRTFEPLENRMMVGTGLGLLVLGVLFAAFPRVLAYPIAFVLAWFAVALIYRGGKLRRKRPH